MITLGIKSSVKFVEQLHLHILIFLEIIAYSGIRDGFQLPFKKLETVLVENRKQKNSG